VPPVFIPPTAEVDSNAQDDPMADEADRFVSVVQFQPTAPLPLLPAARLALIHLVERNSWLGSGGCLIASAKTGLPGEVRFLALGGWSCLREARFSRARLRV